MSLPPEHPAASADAAGKVCADPRCATLLDSDAEICDECGGSQLQPLESMGARLCGWAGERPVVFGLREDQPAIVGRSARGGQVPDVDLRRFPGSQFVHRRHARLERNDDASWRVTHLGTNLLMVIGSQRAVLDPGAIAVLRSGDRLQVGDVILQFVERRSAGRM